MDIGCGCGVVGLGLILAGTGKDIRITGLDKCPDMISHCRKNAETLGLAHRYSTLEMDVTQVNGKTIQAESFDLAVANPPYRKPGSGRMPAEETRHKACFCDTAELDAFFRAAAFLVKNKGKVGIVFGTERLDELLALMNKHSLTPKKILPVYGNMARPSPVVLVEGIKNAGQGITMMPPLILYDECNQLTSKALKFCPFLECNPKR